MIHTPPENKTKAPLLHELRAAGATITGSAIRCPYHDDRDPSGGVYERGGTWRFKCHGCGWCGDIYDVRAERTGQPLEKIMKNHNSNGVRHSPQPTSTPTRPNSSSRRIVAKYDYRDESGKLLFQCLRYDPKDFRQRQPDGAGGWKWHLRGVTRVLYRLPELLSADGDDVIFITEGEKDADRLADMGMTATTCPMGAGKWHTVDDEPLRSRRVAIIPDNDDNGRSHARSVAEALHGRVADVRIIELPGLREKGDVSDWVDAGGTADDLRRLIDGAASYTPQADDDDDVEPPVHIPWRPFPTGLLPDPLRSFVEEGAAAIGCDETYVALPALSVCASAIGTTRSIKLKKSWCEPCVLWAVAVGKSGTLKSPPLDLALEPLRKNEKTAYRQNEEMLKLFEAEHEHYAVALRQWQKSPIGDPPTEPEPPARTRYTASDTTIEALATILSNNPRGVLLARDELSGWVGSFDAYKGGKGDDAAKWLELHRAGTLLIDRKTGDKKNIRCDRAAVSICGTIQPGIIQQRLTREHYESGLAARLLLAYPPPKPKRWTEDDITDATEDAYAGVVDTLLGLEHEYDDHGDPRPVCIALSPAAKAAWIAYYERQALAQADAVSDDIAAAFSKIEGYAARLSLIIHCVRQANGEDVGDDVDEQSVLAGTRLAEWFGYEAERVYGQFAENEEQSERRRLIELIQRKGGDVNARELVHGIWQISTVTEAEEILNQLVGDGYGNWEQPQQSGPGRQRSRRFKLKPLNSVNVNETPPGDSANAYFVDVDFVDAPENQSKGGNGWMF